MVDAETNEVFFDGLEIPEDGLIGEEGNGLKYIFDGLNAERILISGECIGDGYWFMEHAVERAKSRVVFDRPIGQNQGIQFPIAEAYMEVRAADLMRFRACALFDANRSCGAEANMAKSTWPPKRHGRRPTSVCKPMAVSLSPARMTSSASLGKPGFTKSRRSRPI